MDSGKFDWSESDKFPSLSAPEQAYHGLKFHETFGPLAFTFHSIAIGLRDLGMTMNPQAAHYTLLGIETLSLRMQRHVENAQKIAAWLEADDRVEYVTYAGLPSSPYQERVQKHYPKGAGALFTFAVKGGYDACVRLVNALEIFSHVANLGDARSLIIHSASTTHRQLTAEQQEAAGASPNVVRVSIGDRGCRRSDRRSGSGARQGLRLSAPSTRGGMTEHRTNTLGQPIGDPVSVDFPRPVPPRTPMTGRFCSITPLDPKAHAPDLYRAFAQDTEGRNWTYLPYGPFASEVAFTEWMEANCTQDDPLFHTILDAGGKPIGMASYLRIDPANGVIEVGHIHFSPLLQRRPEATETMYLMMRRVFDELGYRRYEWKCDALNAPSCRAAERLGFTFEGIFRQATHYKGRNRDTAWYAIIDKGWPRAREAFEAWLMPDNFDAAGQQLQPLTARHSE